MLIRPTEPLFSGNKTVCKYVWGRRPEKSLHAQWCQEHTEGRQMEQCLMKDLEARFWFTRHQYNSLLGVINVAVWHCSEHVYLLLHMMLLMSQHATTSPRPFPIVYWKQSYWSKQRSGIVAKFSAPWVSSMHVSWVLCTSWKQTIYTSFSVHTDCLFGCLIVHLICFWQPEVFLATQHLAVLKFMGKKTNSCTQISS